MLDPTSSWSDTHVAFALRVERGGLIINPGAPLRDPASPIQGAAMYYRPESGTFEPALELHGGTFGMLELSTTAFKVYRAADGREVDILRVKV